MTIHVAITRIAKAGKEAEFQDRLRQFFHESFSHSGVVGASMIVPAAGSGSREFGILRSFASSEDREAFYASAMFKKWNDSIKHWTEGEPIHRDLHGLEVWFRTQGGPPSRWKMAIVTFLGVYPISLALTLTIGPHLKTLPAPVSSLIFSGLMIAMLTWVIMPWLTRVLHAWLVRK